MSQSGLVPARARGALPFTFPVSPAHPLIITTLLIGLTLILLLLGTRLADPYLSLTVGGPADEQHLVRFHEPELNETETYRWSQPVAGIFLYGFDGRPALVDLRLTSPRPADAPPATVALAVGEQDLGTFAIEPGWRHYRVLAPTHAAGDTALLLQSSFFRPGSHDSRDLGVALSQVTARPLAGQGMFPPLQRTGFLLSLPLLVWLLLWRAGVAPPFAASAGVLLALVAGWAAANPLQSGYLLPTIWWPWWPFVPLLALVVAPMAYRRLRGLVPLAPWSGLALTFAAVLAVRLGFPAGPGMALMLVGTLLALTGLAGVAASAAPAETALPRRREAALLAALTLLALGLRLYHLDSLPLGIWRDEARHASLALRIWQDPAFRPVYVVSGADLPALLFYLMAPVVGLFGPHVWSARLVSALAGALTPLALWWAARPLVGARAALFGAALVAWSSWSLSMSRWAFPATLDHVLVLTAIGLMWRALPLPVTGAEQPARASGWMAWSGPFASSSTRRATLWLILAALCAGLAAYTYHTGRIAPLILAALTLVRLGAVRDHWRRAAPALVAAGLVGLLTLAPLIGFIAGDWEGYNRRVARVSVLDTNNTEVHAPVSLLLRNAERYLLMWHVQGEPNGRHHAPGAPMLDPVAGTLLLIGTSLAIVQWRRPEMQAVLVLFGLAFIPGLFSGSAPHAMRSLGTLAPAAMLAGLALEALRRQVRPGPAAPVLLLVPLLAASMLFNTWLYFGVMPRTPAVYNEFYVTETAMARVARAAHETDDPVLQEVQLFLPAKELRSDALRYLTSDIQVQSFDVDRFSVAPGPQALLLMPASISDEVRENVLRAAGPGFEAVAAVPHYPQGERALFLAYARGDAPRQLLHETFPQ